MRTSRLAATLASVTILELPGVASAQMPNCVGRPDFDYCMQSFTANNQARLAQSQQQLFQQYIQSNGPWLQRAYAEHRAARGQMTFQQFAYWGLMTANGTNLAGAAQAQRDWFAGQQGAQETVQQGNRDYRQGMYDNSRRTSDTAQRYDNGAVRGVAPYIDPQTGQAVMLPYGSQPGQPFNSGGNTYVQDQQGNYRQWMGNGWAPMTPAR